MPGGEIGVIGSDRDLGEPGEQYIAPQRAGAPRRASAVVTKSRTSCRTSPARRSRTGSRRPSRPRAAPDDRLPGGRAGCAGPGTASSSARTGRRRGAARRTVHQLPSRRRPCTVSPVISRLPAQKSPCTTVRGVRPMPAAQPPARAGRRARRRIRSRPAGGDLPGHAVEQRDRRGPGRAVGVQGGEPVPGGGEVGAHRGRVAQMPERVVARPHRHAGHHRGGDGQHPVHIEDTGVPGQGRPDPGQRQPAQPTRKPASRSITSAAAGVVAIFTARCGCGAPGAITRTVTPEFGSRDPSSRTVRLPGAFSSARRSAGGLVPACRAQGSRAWVRRIGHAVLPTTTRPAASDPAAPGQRRSNLTAASASACAQVTPGGGRHQRPARPAERVRGVLDHHDGPAQRGERDVLAVDDDRAGRGDPARPQAPARPVVQQDDRGPGGQRSQFRDGTPDGQRPGPDVNGHGSRGREQPPPLARSRPLRSHDPPQCSTANGRILATGRTRPPRTRTPRTSFTPLSSKCAALAGAASS